MPEGWKAPESRDRWPANHLLVVHLPGVNTRRPLRHGIPGDATDTPAHAVAGHYPGGKAIGQECSRSIRAISFVGHDGGLYLFRSAQALQAQGICRQTSVLRHGCFTSTRRRLQLSGRCWAGRSIQRLLTLMKPRSAWPSMSRRRCQNRSQWCDLIDRDDGTDARHPGRALTRW